MNADRPVARDAAAGLDNCRSQSGQAFSAAQMANGSKSDDEPMGRRRRGPPPVPARRRSKLVDPGTGPLRPPPADLHALRQMIASGIVAIEPKADVVVRFALARPVDVALGTALSLAEICQVSPSVVARLVKAFGFSRFADFRDLFKQSVRSGCAGLEIAYEHEVRIG